MVRTFLVPLLCIFVVAAGHEAIDVETKKKLQSILNIHLNHGELFFTQLNSAQLKFILGFFSKILLMRTLILTVNHMHINGIHTGMI